MADTIEVSTREFTRQFAEMKKLARGGARLRVHDGASVFRFELVHRKGGFLGAAKGALQSQSKPELLYSTGEAWEGEAPS